MESTTSPQPDTTSMIRVLFFDHTAELGGGEIALLNLVLYLRPRSVKPLVVIGMDGPLVEKLRARVDTYVLPLPYSVTTRKKDSLRIATLFPSSSYFWPTYICLAAFAIYSQTRHRFGSHEFPEGGHHPEGLQAAWRGARWSGMSVIN